MRNSDWSSDVCSSDLGAAPGGDGGRGVGEGERHQPAPGGILDMMPGDAEVMAVADTDRDDPGLADDPGRGLQAQADGGKGEAEPRVDVEDGRRGAGDRRLDQNRRAQV